MLKKLTGLGPINVSKLIFRKIYFLIFDLYLILRTTFDPEVVLYIGFVGQNNLGDEILYESHKALFSKARLVHINYKLTIIIANYIRRPFFKNALLGGGTLIDHSDNWLSIVEKLNLYGTKLACIGTGVEDPIYWPKSVDKSEHMGRWINVLTHFNFVGVRGPISRNILEEHGFKKIIIVGDTALSLTTPKSISGSNNVIGITYGNTPGSSMWGNETLYEEEMVKVIKSFIKKDYEVHLLPIWDLDIKSNLRIYKKINDMKNCKIIKAFDSYENFTKELKKCDYFIGQKLHASIMSVMCGVPTIMVEYQPKCRDFMSSVGLNEYVVKTSDFKMNKVVTLFEKLRKSEKAVKANSLKNIEEYKKVQKKAAVQISKNFGVKGK